jgi:lambda family phage portal protein
VSFASHRVQRDAIERVPADQIIHLAVIDRWPQTRGEPWMHAVARTFNDMSGYTEAEITRARIRRLPFLGRLKRQKTRSRSAKLQSDGSVEMDVEPGVAKRLNPGEKMNAPAPNSPNPALDPFMRYMLREVAAGTGPSYESLSRDYSQSELLKLAPCALGRSRPVALLSVVVHLRLPNADSHREWLQQAVLGWRDPEVPVAQYAADVSKKFEAVLFKPRGWTWIDPTKEVEAYKEAVKCGFTTVSDVVAQPQAGRTSKTYWLLAIVN